MSLMDKHFEGHEANIVKDYDVLRCPECDAILKVPKEAMSYECFSCHHVIEFEEVVEIEIDD